MANESNPCPCDLGDKIEYGGLGQEVQMEHIKAYVVKPTSPKDKAVIVIHDIFGWQLPNTRYMAEMLAADGYMCVQSDIWGRSDMFMEFNLCCSLSRAVCPDFFVGKEPWSPAGDWSKFQEWLQDKKPTTINKCVTSGHLLKSLSCNSGFISEPDPHWNKLIFSSGRWTLF